MMRKTIVLGSILLFSVGLAWAEEPNPASDVKDIAAVGESVCNAEQPLPQEELPLAAWAEEHGFEVVPVSEVAAAALTCPVTNSCNTTHCVETTFCATQDTGSGTCCVGFSCLACLAGQTIHVKKCRCNGSGCSGPSQSFFCA